MMATDCFGNPSPYPPSIADCYADIMTYRPIPLDQRMEYHYARVDAMVGRGTVEAAWNLYHEMNADLRRLAREAA